jgi:hypothetical protein
MRHRTYRSGYPQAPLHVPALSRHLIKFAIVWLLVGLSGWSAAATWGGPRGPLALAAFHALTVGWLTQVVFGVAIWFFPKRRGDAPRGSEALGRAVLVALNLGVLVRLIAEPARGHAVWSDALVVVAGGLQTAAAVGFVLLMRGRIRGT